MSKPLTTTQRERMFQAWCQDASRPHVVRTCAVSKTTVDKYRVLDDWDNRLSKITAKAKAKLDDKETDYTVEQLKIVRNVKNVYLTCLVGKTPCPHCKKPVPVPKMDPKFADIDKIIRLEELLRGKPDSRPDLGRLYDEMSDEELDRLCNESMDELTSRLLAAMQMKRLKDIKKAIGDIINELG